MAMENTVKTNPKRTMTARAIIQDMEVLLSRAFIIPPIPMIGAKNTILIMLMITI